MTGPTDTAIHGLPKLMWFVVATLLAVGVALFAAMPASASGPTCSDLFWSNHGEHIVGDYVTGEGTELPPAGGVGEAIAGDGASAPGASGIHQHGPEPGTVPPGASFCLEQANSPRGKDLPDQAGP